MDEKDKFQEAQQQLQILFNASQMASLPARDHQAIQQSAQSLADFINSLNPNGENDGGGIPAMPEVIDAE